MKKMLLTLALLLAPTFAWGQCTGVAKPGDVCGNPTGTNSTPRLTPITGFNISSLSITYTQIPTKANLPATFATGGYRAINDIGQNCIYSSLDATSTGPAAIQDSLGNWYNAVINNTVNIGCFGADASAATDSSPGIQAAIDAALTQDNNTITGGSNQTTYCPAGVYTTSRPIFVDPPGNLRGADGINGTAYNGASTYIAGVTVNSGGIAYISLQNANIGNTPASSPTWWRVFVWNSGTTYALNDVVSYNGIPWISQAGGNIGNIPVVGAASPGSWAPTTMTPTAFSFGASFVGEESLGNIGQHRGCLIEPTYNSSIGMWVGPGNGNIIKSIFVWGQAHGYRGAQYSSGVGIAISGGGGGANRTTIENTDVANFYTLYRTGVNEGSLAAENTWRKVNGTNCFNGIQIGSAQNYINDIIEPSITCTNNFTSLSGPSFSITGGNIGTTAGRVGTFGFSSISALTASRDTNNVYEYSFTGVVASPDASITSCGTNIGNCIYNSFTILTSNFGLIPVTMTAWNSGTNTGTFQTIQSWGYQYFATIDATSYTALQADIQSVTTLYAAERVTMIHAQAGNFQNLHVENPNACTTVVNNDTGIVAETGITLTNIFFDYDIAHSGDGTALAYCQQAWAFIIMGPKAQNLVWNNSGFKQGPSGASIIIDYAVNNLARLKFNGNQQSGVFSIFNPIIRGASFGFNTDGQSIYSNGLGAGEWDQTPFMASSAGAAQFNPFEIGSGMVPYIGYHPAAWAHPRIAAGTYTTLQSITSGNALGSYPTINGYTYYSVLDWTGLNARLVHSSHKFDSYGQDLTTGNIPTLSWSYLGQSFAVRADAGTLGRVYPGLGIKLNNGSGNVHYVITGVYPFISLDSGSHPGYFTVLNAEADAAPIGLAGDLNTTYTGTTIGQDTFSWGAQSIQGLSPLGSVAKSAGYTTIASDIGQSVDVTTGASDVTITLLSAVTAGAGNIQYVTKIDAGAGKTVVSNSADLAWLSSAGDTVAVRSNGTTWSVYTYSIAPRTDAFITAGSATWTKPPLAKTISPVVIGGGAGGASGARAASGTATSGGSGGAGGGLNFLYNVAASYYAATETLVVGAAGTPGAAISIDSTNGNDGVIGGISTFSSGAKILTLVNSGRTAPGGGKAGANSTADNSQAGRLGSQASVANVSGAAGSAAVQTSNILQNYAAGGGAGQAITTPANLNGGLSGKSSGQYGDVAGTAGIGSTKTNPTTGTGATFDMGIILGASGGGGWAASDGTAGAGSAGTGCGGGGGGGASSVNGSNSGAGGAGHDGCVYVITKFN